MNGKKKVKKEHELRPVKFNYSGREESDRIKAKK